MGKKWVLNFWSLEQLLTLPGFQPMHSKMNVFRLYNKPIEYTHTYAHNDSQLLISIAENERDSDYYRVMDGMLLS